MKAKSFFFRFFWCLFIILLWAWTSLCTMTHTGGFRYTYYPIESVRYWNVLKTHPYITKPLYCMFLCHNEPDCNSINYHKVDYACELCSDEIGVVLPPFTLPLDANWIVYYRDIEVIPIAAAWRIHETEGPSRIEDTFGNVLTNPIETTATTFWRVEMPKNVFVTKLNVYFGADAVTNAFFIGDFTMMVSKTTMETVDDEGTPCGLYTGGFPVAILPMILKCKAPLFGKYLKPVHDFSPPMQLLNIKVYTF